MNFPVPRWYVEVKNALAAQHHTHIAATMATVGRQRADNRQIVDGFYFATMLKVRRPTSSAPREAVTITFHVPLIASWPVPR